MDLLITGIAAGLLGTLAMDLFNNLVARVGIFLKIDVAMIGRMAVGWIHGRFRYEHPDEMEQVPNEMVYGYLAHFAIGGKPQCYSLRLSTSTCRLAVVASINGCQQVLRDRDYYMFSTD